MRVFTNKYFPLHNYKNIYSYLKQSKSILKFDNKVYIPLIIESINYKKIEIINSNYIPNSFEYFRSKFIYVGNNFYDLIDEDNIRSYKVFNKIIYLSKDTKKGDILLIKDTDKFNGVI
jgi:hypothetical protein